MHTPILDILPCNLLYFCYPNLAPTYRVFLIQERVAAVSGGFWDELMQDYGSTMFLVQMNSISLMLLSVELCYNLKYGQFFSFDFLCQNITELALGLSLRYDNDCTYVYAMISVTVM